MSGSDPATAVEKDERLGQTLQGRYRIEAPLGAGGLGIIYRATHLGLGRAVAIKVLHQELLARADHRQRFEREVAMLSQLHHPHIVTVTDSGVLPDGTGFLVMELLEGESLEERLKRGPMPPVEAVDVARQILLGLAAAHEKGILHRDIKPANVFVQPLADGRLHVKLLDFGLAKGQRDMGAVAQAYPTLTRDGTVVGTPTTMAPEQAVGAGADARSDLYSVGVVFFTMLTGRPPFDHEDKVEVIRMHIRSEVPELDEVNPDLKPSPALRGFVQRALKKSPAERFESASDMLAELDALPDPIAETTAAAERSVVSGHEETISLGSSAVGTLEVKVTKAPARPRAAERAGARGALFAVLVAVGAIGGIAAAWALWPEPDGGERDGDEPAPDDPAPPPEDEVAAEPEGEPGNPFETGTLPDELWPARRLIVRGRSLGEEHVRDVTRYQREHPEDLRPSLLLARHHRFRREWAQSVRHYRAAFRIDPAAAVHFPTMLPDALRAGHEAESFGAAGKLLADAYGRDALPELDRALAARPSHNERVRLQRIRRRLESLP